MASLKEAIENVRDKNDDAMHVVNISGGKDSAALAVYIRTKYPEIHKCAEYVFCDTQCELEETYEYLETLEDYLGKPVQRLNALELLDIRDKPDRIRLTLFFANSLVDSYQAHEVAGAHVP